MIETRKRAPLDLSDLAALALVAVQAAMAVYIYQFGPAGPIAVHFDLQGHPNGWADRHAVAIGIEVLAGITAAINLMLRIGVSRQPGFVEAKRTFALTQAVMLATAAMFTTLLVSLALANGQGISLLRLPLSLVWLIFIIVGAFVGKVAPNPFLGVRVYWTLHSRLAWDKANRLAGRIFFFGGLIGLLAMPFVDLSRGITVFLAELLVLIGGGGALAIFESWRVWRDDPERIP